MTSTMTAGNIKYKYHDVWFLLFLLLTIITWLWTCQAGPDGPISAEKGLK